MYKDAILMLWALLIISRQNDVSANFFPCVQIHCANGSRKGIDWIPLDLNADKTSVRYFQITTYIINLDCRICHTVTDFKTNMHIKTVIHLLNKRHLGVLF